MPRLRVILAAILSLIVLSGCVPEDRGSALPPVGEELVALEKARCEAGGGIWGATGDDGERAGYVCFRQTRDAMKGCERDSDCEGFCLARSRTCAPVTPLLGCNEILTSLGVRSTVCIE